MLEGNIVSISLVRSCCKVVNLRWESGNRIDIDKHQSQPSEMEREDDDRFRYASAS